MCGAKSCPPIKLYSPDTLEEGLEAAAEAFIAADVEVDKAAKKVDAHQGTVIVVAYKTVTVSGI